MSLKLIWLKFTNTEINLIAVGCRDLMKAVTKELNTGQHHQATQTLVRIGLALSQIRLQRRFKNIVLLGGAEKALISHEEGNTRLETSAMLHVLIYHFTHTSLPFYRQLMKWVSRELNAGQHHQACESPSTLATTLSQIQLQRRSKNNSHTAR